MKLFDMHCDTIEEMRKNGETFQNCTTQFSLKDMDKFEAGVQALAVFVPDDVRGEAAVKFVDDYADYMQARVAEVSDKAALVERTADIRKINAEHKWAFMRTIESAACLNGKLELVDHFAARNFKMMGLVWNGSNELGSGWNHPEQGLTDFGKAAVKRMEEVGMIVDCSHLNDRGMDDLFSIAEKPIAASHSNVRAVCKHRRNLTDEQFKEIVRRGGVCGVNLFTLFLSDEDSNDPDFVFRHIYHMLELGGEDTIAFGADFDGEITAPRGMDNPYGVGCFAEYLLKKGISQQVIDKLYYENAVRFFEKNVK